MNKTIKSKSGHTLFIEEIQFSNLPEHIKLGDWAKDFKQFYSVKNWDADGPVFMYLVKGQKGAPKEICVIYPKGGFWSSFGTTFEKAINGAQEDGWLYA